MKNNQQFARKEKYVKLKAASKEGQVTGKSNPVQQEDLKDRLASHLFTMSPSQYWAGPHFFFNSFPHWKK